MRIAREKVINLEWVIEIKGFVIPLSLIKSCVLFLVMCSIFVLAFNVGQQAAAMQVEYLEYMHTEGCSPHAQGVTIVWTCQNKTSGLPISFNTSYIKP